MIKAFLITTISSMALVGCNTTAKPRSISFIDSAPVSSRLYVWNADVSAGVGNKKGTCVQTALTDKAFSANAALDVIKEVNAGAAAAQSILALNPSNTQTTFATTAYFALCQMALNGSISQDETKALFSEITKEAKSINIASPKLESLDAPTAIDVLKDVLAANSVSLSETTMDQVEDALEKAAE